MGLKNSEGKRKGNLGKDPSERSALPVYEPFQLLKGEEDEDRCRLETRPGRDPALEHEHWSLVRQRGTDDTQGRLYSA